MSISEMAKDLTIALINRVALPGKGDDEQHPAKWVGTAYQIIHKAIREALK